MSESKAIWDDAHFRAKETEGWTIERFAEKSLTDSMNRAGL